MNTDSPEKQIAREAMDRAVRQYVRVLGRESETANDPIVIGWACYAEYTSVELEQEDKSGNAVIVPVGQNATMSRGCFEVGADAFRRDA